MKRIALLASCLLIFTATQMQARGISPYLPLHLEPEIERQVERVLLLAGHPVLTRPLPAATVFDALPRACELDPVVCGQVRRYLARYMEDIGIAHLSIEGAAASGAETTLANRHGMGSSSAWQAAARLYWQPSDFFAINLGGIAHEGDTTPTDTYVSVGFSLAQLDVGYRDHWFSPMTESSLLIGSQASTMPSATLSNYTPMTRLGLRYQVFLAEMSRSERIAFEDGYTAGRPQLLGMHLSIEPASGWSLGVNRLMQFGGGERGGNSIGDVFDAFFNPSSHDNANPDLDADDEFGNQLASITSRFVFPGPTPLAVYFEYAGEDTSRSRSYLLGNAALSAGIQLPRIWRRFDLTFEASEWQNGWYVNHIYGDGLTNEGHVIGHWFGDARATGDAVGGQSQMLRLGWDPQFGGAVELRLRSIENESYSSVDYQRGHDVAVRYSRPFGGFTVGAEALAGRDVFGQDFSRFGLFARHGNYSSNARSPSIAPGSAADDDAHLFVAIGANVSEVTSDLTTDSLRTKSDWSAAPHLAFGARRAVAPHSDLGARVEFDDIEGRLLLGFRAVDYRYRFAGPLALGAFLGAARYDLETPAYGIYGGVGAQWRNLLPAWDLDLELRYASKVARDRLLSQDPDSDRPDVFYDIAGATLSLTRRF